MPHVGEQGAGPALHAGSCCQDFPARASARGNRRESPTFRGRMGGERHQARHRTWPLTTIRESSRGRTTARTTEGSIDRCDRLLRSRWCSMPRSRVGVRGGLRVLSSHASAPTRGRHCRPDRCMMTISTPSRGPRMGATAPPSPGAWARRNPSGAAIGAVAGDRARLLVCRPSGLLGFSFAAAAGADGGHPDVLAHPRVTSILNRLHGGQRKKIFFFFFF